MKKTIFCNRKTCHLFLWIDAIFLEVSILRFSDLYSKKGEDQFDNTMKEGGLMTQKGSGQNFSAVNARCLINYNKSRTLIFASA